MLIITIVLSLFTLYVHSINIIQVRVSNDSSNSWIVQHDRAGFIVDCGCYWEHGLVLGQTWQKNFPQDQLPAFIFLTHTHPENILGLVSLFHELNTTQVPVYVSNSGALNEINYWLEIWKEINPFDTSILLDKRQSPTQFRYGNYIKVLDRPLSLFAEDNPIHIISNFPVAESIYASMIYLPSANALFTGDLVAVHSHLFVSPFDSQPEADLHVCNWIGILQSLRCAFPELTNIYPAHGNGSSGLMSFTDTIETNIQWLTYMRALVFNSCNTTFVMRILEEVFANYSNSDQSRASLANRIPHSAMSIGCKCVQNSPSTCGGLQPPACQFVPKNRTLSLQSTALPLACVHRRTSSSSSSSNVLTYLQIEYTVLFMLLSANIF